MQRQPFSRNDSPSSGNVPTRRSPSAVNQSSATAPPVGRAISSQSVADITMAEAPAQTPPPRTFTSNALTEAESQTVTDLLNHLGESSYAYDSHLQLISLLHKGFITHCCPPEGSDEPGQDPSSFGLLAELRGARESMDSRFAVGKTSGLNGSRTKLCSPSRAKNASLSPSCSRKPFKMSHHPSPCGRHTPTGSSRVMLHATISRAPTNQAGTKKTTKFAKIFSPRKFSSVCWSKPPHPPSGESIRVTPFGTAIFWPSSQMTFTGLRNRS